MPRRKPEFAIDPNARQAEVVAGEDSDGLESVELSPEAGGGGGDDLSGSPSSDLAALPAADDGAEFPPTLPGMDPDVDCLRASMLPDMELPGSALEVLLVLKAIRKKHAPAPEATSDKEDADGAARGGRVAEDKQEDGAAASGAVVASGTDAEQLGSGSSAGVDGFWDKVIDRAQELHPLGPCDDSDDEDAVKDHKSESSGLPSPPCSLS